MKNHTSTSGHGVPDAFLHKFGHDVTGILSGFDRFRFRGTLRRLFDPTIMEIYLLRCHVLIKQFKTFAEGLTQRIKAAAYQTAHAAGQPVRYLPRADLSKEDLTRQFARDDHLCPDWPKALNRLLAQAHPLHAELSCSLKQDHDWSASQTEFVTDLRFRNARSLVVPYATHGFVFSLR